MIISSIFVKNKQISPQLYENIVSLISSNHFFMAQHNLFGQEAEQKALSFLLDKGYVLLEKNYRFGKAEIDLLMKHHDILICI